MGLGAGHPHGHGLLHELQLGFVPVNPSFFLVNATLKIIPNNTPTNSARPGTTKLICLVIGVNHSILY
jgi:hypothetical protein